MTMVAVRDFRDNISILYDPQYTISRNVTNGNDRQELYKEHVLLPPPHKEIYKNRPPPPTKKKKKKKFMGIRTLTVACRQKG